MTPFLAISIMPLLVVAPLITPMAAIIVTVLYDADFVPTADDMKLQASLLTPAHNPKMANTITKTKISGNKNSIFNRNYKNNWQK